MDITEQSTKPKKSTPKEPEAVTARHDPRPDTFEPRQDDVLDTREGPPSSAMAAFTALAAPQIEIARDSAGALKQQDDSDTFHKLRVSLRRLRSLLWAYEPLVGHGIPRQWNERLADIANIAGNTRDWDVTQESLLPKAKFKGRKTQTRLASALSRHRNTASLESRMALDRRDIPQLLADFHNSLQAAGTGSANDPDYQAFAKKRIKKATRNVTKRAKAAIEGKRANLDALHRTRIAVKKLRYVLEYFEPVLETQVKKKTKQLTKVQTHLGHLNDIVTAQALVKKHLLPEPDSARAGARFERWLANEAQREAKAARKILRPHT